jgi:hypothetical protein
MLHFIQPRFQLLVMSSFFVFTSLMLKAQNNDNLPWEVTFINAPGKHPNIGQYQKLELGLQLPEKINAWVDDFLNNAKASYLNPYDPDQISVEAIFIHGQDSFISYGFYYNDYRRDIKLNNVWRDHHTEYHWRIRFAPPDTGRWRCHVQVCFPGGQMDTLRQTEISFNVYNTAKKGFITVANDKRHLKYAGTNESFFAIGQNIAWTDEPIFKGAWANGNMSAYNFSNKEFTNRLYHVGFMDLSSYVRNLGENNGTLARVLNWQDSYIFEWEERGVYGSNRTTRDKNFERQKRAWELDQLFETAEAGDIKLLFCMEFGGQFSYDWNQGDANSFYFNPYNKVVNNGVTDMKLPTEFFEDPVLIKAYKNKIRYFMARWGYSPSLGIVQLLNEFDGWSTDSTQVKERICDRINSEIKLQNHIKNWHDEIGQYIHRIGHRPVIVTSGLMLNTRPTEIPMSRNFFNTQGMDMVTWNRYGNDRSINYEMYLEANKIMDAFDKPFLFSETGIITNAEKNADPSDLEGCDDVMFHNFLWAGSAMGQVGTSLEWWQAFDNTRRENFKALYAFYSTIDFEARKLTLTDRWNDKGTSLYTCGRLVRKLKKTSLIEVYYVRSDKNDKSNTQQSFGWAHNLTHYWANLASYTNCPDRHNHLVVIKSCADDENAEPIVLNATDYTIKLKGFKPRKTYTVQWHSTRGEGGLISSTQVVANGWGNLIFLWPGTDFDYAFKIIEETGGAFNK